MPVHNIDVDQVSASGFDPANLFSQAGKIGGEDGWCDLCHRLVLMGMRPYDEREPRIRPRCRTDLASHRECRGSPRSVESGLRALGRWHQAAYLDVQPENVVPPGASLPARSSIHCTLTPRELRATPAGHGATGAEPL